jgi:hypothetical protein
MRMTSALARAADLLDLFGSPRAPARERSGPPKPAPRAVVRNARDDLSMNSYKLVLLAVPPARDRTGYVYCATDEQARAAARALLQFHEEHDVVQAYQGERLVCQIVRQERKAASA